MRGHLTPREAGEHGKAAARKRLVITHISDELDDALGAASEAQDALRRRRWRWPARAPSTTV